MPMDWLVSRSASARDFAKICTDVKVMESRPPPAPARAWATLSLCCAILGAPVRPVQITQRESSDKPIQRRQTEELSVECAMASRHSGCAEGLAAHLMKTRKMPRLFDEEQEWFPKGVGNGMRQLSHIRHLSHIR